MAFCPFAYSLALEVTHAVVLAAIEQHLQNWSKTLGIGEQSRITRYTSKRCRTFVVNKSVNKVFIIQSVDRKLPLEDIADAKGLDMEELLSEIEAIVYSGTKLNLDYYIEQTLDEDVVEEIFDYFHDEAESDSLEAAMEELGSDYDEQEVRLVRIKFLCEVAN